MTGEAHALVLGTAQDGGVPQAGCGCPTCAAARRDPSARRRVASLAVVGGGGTRLVVDATPDLGDQLALLAARTGRAPLPESFLLTHAHMGHYLGLAHLGREAMGARGVAVHATARMEAFLRGNRPWAHLLDRGEVRLVPLVPGHPVAVDDVRVEAFPVRHRAEDTDTVGVEVRGPRRRLVYVPDADAFDPDLAARIRAADLALVDGTFHGPDELPHRDLAAVPHPFVRDGVRILAGARGPVWFTHLNHTNPLLHSDPARRPALPPGFGVAAEGKELPL